MGLPTVPLHICNLSLDLLKQAPINSIDTPKTTAEFIFARWYDMTRRKCLRAHPWKFASKRILLTPDPATPPPYGYTYAYDLPADYIRTIFLGNDYLGDVVSSFEIENGQILAPSGEVSLDGQTMYFRYVFDQQDVKKFDALFTNYFVHQLAVDLSNKFSISSTVKKDIQADLVDIKAEAKTVNGQDRRPKRVQYSRMITKRRGLPGGIYASKYTTFAGG